MATEATTPGLDTTSDDGLNKLNLAQQKLFDEKIAERLQRHQKELQNKNKKLEEDLVAAQNELIEVKRVSEATPPNSASSKNITEEALILKNEIEELKKANKAVQLERDTIRK